MTFFLYFFGKNRAVLLNVQNDPCVYIYIYIYIYIIYICQFTSIYTKQMHLNTKQREWLGNNILDIRDGLRPNSHHLL